MAAAVKLREDFSADELRALARRSKEVDQSPRLLSLAAASKLTKKLRSDAEGASCPSAAAYARRNLVPGRSAHRPEERLVRRWVRRGARPRQPTDQRYENAYLCGAICAAKGKGAALALPYVDTRTMQLHLDEISRHVARGAHAALLLDRAGWHTTAKLAMPKNITPILLPSRAPELNPVENVWQYLRQNWLANRVFENYDAIIGAACDAWQRLIAQPQTITSIGMRDWAHISQSS
jgi:transposase